MTISSLYLLIPAVLLVLVGIWGWRNADSWASAYPLDERTQKRRRRVYQRGAVACVVAAAAFVLLIVLSYLGPPGATPGPPTTGRPPVGPHS